MTATIKFSHRYLKMKDGFEQSVLLDVLPVKLETLSARFLEYDTVYIDENGNHEHYPLPAKGDYMILMLRSTAIEDEAGDIVEPSQLWTTIRRRTPEKEKYYRNLIGQVMECKIVA